MTQIDLYGKDKYSFNYSQKLSENGISESKGKGKGKGKGKSSIISSKTSGECEVEAKPLIPPKRASKSAAELYKNILNDDENDDILEEDDSDEDVIYGQDDSDSDEAEEVLNLALIQFRRVVFRIHTNLKCSLVLSK